MNIPQCPKNLNHCPAGSCPEYPCWAYEQYLDNKDKVKKERDSGWD